MKNDGENLKVLFYHSNHRLSEAALHMVQMQLVCVKDMNCIEHWIEMYVQVLQYIKYWPLDHFWF